MITEKDLFLRMLTFFLQKLAEKLSEKPIAEITDLEMEDFYLTALKSERNNIIHLNKEALANECRIENKFSIEKCRIMAELFYIEVNRITDDARRKYAEKSLYLFEKYLQASKTFDFDVAKKVDELKSLI